jgi:hypothetical protein
LAPARGLKLHILEEGLGATEGLLTEHLCLARSKKYIHRGTNPQGVRTDFELELLYWVRGIYQTHVQRKDFENDTNVVESFKTAHLNSHKPRCRLFS